MKIISALDSVFASRLPEPDPEFDHHYEDEDEWNRDYLKSEWPSGARHFNGQARLGGPDLEDHPSFDDMYAAGWRPSRTRDALVHQKGRVLTFGISTRYNDQYPQGRKTYWFEQARGEGPVYTRSHEKLADALTAKKWDEDSSYPEAEDEINRDVNWLHEDRNRGRE